MSRIMKALLIAGCLSASSCGDDPVAEDIAPLLTGSWDGTLGGQSVTFILNEEPGGAVSGDAWVAESASTSDRHYWITGRHEHPSLTLELTLSCAFCPVSQWTFDASVSEDRLEGALSGNGFRAESLVMTRRIDGPPA